MTIEGEELTKQQRWREKNRDRYLAQAREYSRTRNWSEAKYLSRYGMTLEEYDVLLASQNGVCPICGGTRSGGDRRMPVDHCHVTGKVRGILCDPCNKGLGHFKDDLERLRAAVAYLEAHQ